MKIWLLTVGEPLPVLDEGTPRLLRTGLLARVLRSRGHQVTWWTSSFDHYRKRQRVDGDTVVSWEDVELRVLRSVGYRTNFSPSRFVEHAGVARKFAAHARALPRPHVVVASLPTIELAHEAVRFGVRAGVPVIVDVRDLWPDAMLGLMPAGLSWFGRLALTPLKRKAQAALRGARGIVAVSPSYLEWGLRLAGREQKNSDGVFPIGYVRSPSRPEVDAAAGARLAALGVDERRTLCWYVGSFGRSYDLEPVISAARALDAAGRKDVQFVLSGDGELRERWESLARGLANVVFPGWIDATEIEWLCQRAAIGLQPYARRAPQGLANKLFEYMAAGIPVVSSLGGENEALLAEEQCGLTYAAGDARQCHEKLALLLGDPELRRAMGRRARAAFDRRFDGEALLTGFSQHLEAVAG